ncbi:hypothetical protein [Deinococcus aquaticus]|uniref:hypothetical protein n=1 Tax=Deinococcus aquaticus TaxID=328692 RepID=UPI00362191FB
MQIIVRSSGAYVSSRAVILTGPPDMLLSRAFSAVRKMLREQERSLNERFHLPYYLESPHILIENGGMFGDLHARMWDSNVGAPNLTLAHLVRLGTLMDGLGTVQATRQPGTVDDLTLELGTGEDGDPTPPTCACADPNADQTVVATHSIRVLITPPGTTPPRSRTRPARRSRTSGGRDSAAVPAP